MSQDYSVYKPVLSSTGGGFIFLALIVFGLTLPHLLNPEPITQQKLFGLIGFWFMGLFLTVYPLGFRLEVHNSRVKAYFLRFNISDVSSSQIQSIQYGNLFNFGALGGKGITYRALINGRSRVYSIGEAVYGSEAIAHAHRELLNKN